MDNSPFHAGELALQRRSGMREALVPAERTIRDYLPEQHRELFGRLPTLLLAAQDDSGQPWATLLHGPAGFISTPDARTLRVQRRPAADDPVASCLHEGAAVGLLGLEPASRRRNRANGVVRALWREGLDIEVRQSFGNCPKYIHAREPEALAPRTAPRPRRLGATLDAPALALLRRADTVFIASASSASIGAGRGEGVDVSHRAGPPGFIRVHSDAQGLRLTLPDYRGNHFFNTLGNLLLWPQAGLLVPDFDDGTLLQLAAEASIELDGAALAEFPGAQRLLHLHVRHGWLRPQALALRWTAL
jgi:predicted pyridoxine 5'-phosphate oxidase superfamily flavin-nucleotide-binding protein